MYSYRHAAGITRAVPGVWHGHYGLAHCPAHDDGTPSLALTYGYNGQLLFHCHAGCSFKQIIKALLKTLVFSIHKHILRMLMVIRFLSQNSFMLISNEQNRMQREQESFGNKAKL